MSTDPRGFTLLIAILMSTVAVTLGVSLIDIAYKQVILASTAKQSQIGFYAADSALECALYWDQKFNAFKYTGPLSSGSIKCGGNAILSYTSAQFTSGGNHRRTIFNIQCGTSGNTNGKVTVYKYQTGATSIYANGYSNCIAADQRRVERGLKVFY